jgi:predicted NodU family carbamoyl transferase
MSVLGLSIAENSISACSIINNKVIATASTNSLADAISKLNNPYNTFKSIVCSYADVPAVKRAARNTAVQGVDYCEALSAATLSTTDWSSCAILLSDAQHTKLGYFADNKFYWLRSFDYPNSIALFYAAGVRLLGFDALTQEDHARELSMRGSPIYAPWIKQQLLHSEDGSYSILQNLERGVGTAVPSADIAASIQCVFSDVLVELAQWLRKTIDSDKLAIVGRSASNYISNAEIAARSGYSHIAAISASVPQALALGAASLIQRPLLEHPYTGITRNAVATAEHVASKLLLGERVTHDIGDELSTSTFVNRNILSLAFAPIVHSLGNSTKYVVCQDKDFHSYFEGEHIPYFGEYICRVKNKQVINLDYARVIVVSKNKNPFINRVLELTRAQGYPVLVSTPIL